MIEVDFPDEKALDSAVKALSHEGSIGTRAKSRVMKKEGSLAVAIEAEDVVALRATANAYLRVLNVIENVEEVQR